ncbi:MAG: putative negative regulator of RcsB-dependent stress response [Alcanivorax sp.]
METFRTEEEQVEAIKRWWDENGKSTVAAIVLALAAGFGWQGWKVYQVDNRQAASDVYQTLLQALSGAQLGEIDHSEARKLAGELKTDYVGSTYAEFAAMQLARIAVQDGNLAKAEAELRWVLKKAGKGGDIARIAELRLARVLASRGDFDQALAILGSAGDNPYAASYEAARGDILLAQGRDADAREAYIRARNLATAGAIQPNINMLEQKLQSLSPIPERELTVPTDTDSAVLDSAREPVTDLTSEG